MCRTGDYKYIRRLYEEDEFYDLRLDPKETQNRIGCPEYAPIIAEMKESFWNFTRIRVTSFHFKRHQNGKGLYTKPFVYKGEETYGNEVCKSKVFGCV
mgnify:CR=1 FL=1